MPSEVPNPQTLLTNVPPDAKYFTVINLCSAYFSVPLTEESRYLFAFKYAGKQYTYTRIPQGFKHSPHIFNRILIAELEDKKASGCQVAVLASEQFQRYGRDICSKNLKYKFSENANVNNIRKHLLIFL